MNHYRPITSDNKPKIIFIVARGEAVRNFLYSDTLAYLSKKARVTLLSIIDDGDVIERAKPFVEEIVLLEDFQECRFVNAFRNILHMAHFRWIWSEAVKYYWGLKETRAKTYLEKSKLWASRGIAYMLANRVILEKLTFLDEKLSWSLRPTKEFESLFDRIKPDLVFNCSHIHGPQADLPMRIAHRMGIPTAVFVFSWDNLTSRSRIFVPYNYYLMWNENMKQQLLNQYPFLKSENVFVTGTPQFDFHFKENFYLEREALAEKLGLDPKRPIVLYTTGMDSDFPYEHKIVEETIRIVEELDISPKPQLVVRMYIKGTSPEMKLLSKIKSPHVVFPKILWDETWKMPFHQDLSIYSSLLRHASLGINAASTVSLELMMLNKPVINLGLEPPGSNLEHWTRFSRHVGYEHYKPVAQSGGVKVAHSIDDLRSFIYRGLTEPDADAAKRKLFITSMLGGTLDGNSGTRIAERLLQLSIISR